MGEAAGKLRKKAHILQGLCYLFLPLLFGMAVTKIQKTLGDNIVHLGTLIQRGHGVLEDHLDLAGQLLVLLGGEFSGNTLALVADLAPGHGVDPNNGPADGGLARAGFPNQAKGLPLVDMKTHTAHGVEGVAVGAEVHPQIVHLYEGPVDRVGFTGHAGSPPLPLDDGCAPGPPP